MEGAVDCLKRLKGKTFSARSQASYRREAILRGQLFNIKSRVSRCQRTIGEAQEEIGRLTRNAISGESWAAELIPKSRAMIRAQEEQIAIFEPERVRVQAELNALINPSSAEATARAENQLALAQLALERLECDRALADVIRGAKGLLEKREEMTSKVWGLARKLDLMLDPGGIDKDVVAELENVLRYDLAGQSESWVSWLLGDGPKTEHYIVRDETLFLEETLANAGAYKRGDQIDLDERTLAEIRSTEQTRVAHVAEEVPGGGWRAGPRIEIRDSRVEKIVEAGQ